MAGTQTFWSCLVLGTKKNGLLSLLEVAKVSFGDLIETDSIHKPISVSCAASCCDKHRHSLCIVDEDYDNLIELWLNELKTLNKKPINRWN